MHPDNLSPEPLADQGRRRPNVFKRVVLVIVVATLAWSAFRLPIPIFYAYLPGPVRDVEPLIEVTGEQTYSSEGAFFLTTVSVDTEVTFIDWIAALADPNSMIIMKEDLVPEGTSLEELEEQQREQMVDSKRHAEEVVFSALGLATPTGKGARIVQTVADYPAADVLEKGDVIVRVGGVRVHTTCEVGSAIDALEVGQTVDVTVRRRGEVLNFEIETVGNPQDESAPFIGVHMSDVGYEFDPPAEVEIATGNIAGPSAGFMFSLALYDLLTPDDLTGGLKIAGTGTIACDGGVGPIGGVAQKVAGAEQEGAEIFLAPAANYEEAVRAAGDIEVVSISNFSRALEYLESLR